MEKRIVRQHGGRISIFKNSFNTAKFPLQLLPFSSKIQKISGLHPRFSKVYKLSEKNTFCFTHGDAQLNR